MSKKLCTILLAALLAAPVLAQSSKSQKEGVVFAPQKGQWQVSLALGHNGFYNENTSYYLLPRYSNTQGSIGLPNGSGVASGDLNPYLNINGFNNNSIINIAGLQVKYFVSDCWDINLSFGMNIDITPGKDYVEGDYEVSDMIIPEQKYINAQTKNNWYVTVGTDRYFKTSNPRIHPYVGAAVGFQMARIETMEPYTGKTYDDPDIGEEGEMQIYVAGGKAGQIYGLKAAAVAGVEYSLMKGLVLGLELQPLAYRYDIIQICPQGFDKYNVGHHNIKIFDMPVLKLGFRF